VKTLRRAALLYGVLTLVYFTTVHQRGLVRVERASVELADLGQAVRVASLVSERDAEFEVELERVNERLEDLHAALPIEAGLGELGASIVAAGRSVGAVVSEVSDSPVAEQRREFYDDLLLEVTAEGPVAALLELPAAIERLERLVRVDSYELDRGDDDWRVTMRVRTFVYRSD